LSAGKHVLSEKPVAKDLATAHELIDWYHKNIDTKKTIWAVAENFRYLGRFQYGAEQVQQLGDILGFRLRMHAMVKPGAKYYETEWRKTPEYQASFAYYVLFWSCIADMYSQREVSFSMEASISSPP
jgi:predicted dehydrogenase